jgi:sugar-phosphatase
LTTPAVEAVVLDMDGLLIDTEPVWRSAESAVFAGLGIPLSESDVLGSTGQPIEELIPVWRQRSREDGPSGGGASGGGASGGGASGGGASGGGASGGGGGARLTDAEVADLTDAEVAGLVVDRVIAHVKAEGEAMPGVIAAIALFGRCGLRLAIASSSPRRLIDAVCGRLGLDGIEVRCSAMDEARGKPAPDVYLTAARRLGVAPANCLALEDSPNGVAAAKAAGMRCVAVPDPLLAADPRYHRADLVLRSLTDLDEAALRRLGVPLPG